MINTKLKTLEIAFPPSPNFDFVTKLCVKWSKRSIVNVCVSFLACAVLAMLREAASGGVSSRGRSGGVNGQEVKGDVEFDVVLCQSELTERALQLCHLLPPGFMPVSLNSYHTQPRATLCVSFNGCLMELNSHSSCSGAPISATEISNCLCVLCVCVCWCVSMYVLNHTDFQGSESQAEMLLLSLLVYLSFQQLLSLVSIATLLCFSAHSSPKDIAPALILLLAISYSAPLISAASILCTL